MNKIGFIYIMSNPAHPDLLKIGQTSKDPNERRKELCSTGVPEEFVLEYRALSEDYESLEREIHRKLNTLRFKNNKEFFKISVPDAINEIRGIAGDRIESDKVFYVSPAELERIKNEKERIKNEKERNEREERETQKLKWEQERKEREVKERTEKQKKEAEERDRVKREIEEAEEAEEIERNRKGFSWWYWRLLWTYIGLSVLWILILFIFNFDVLEWSGLK